MKLYEEKIKCFSFYISENQGKEKKPFLSINFFKALTKGLQKINVIIIKFRHLDH